MRIANPAPQDSTVYRAPKENSTDGVPTGLAIGLMSGTSGDGIDAALVEITERPESDFPAVQLRHFRYEPYTEAERRAIVALNDPGTAHLPVAAWHATLGERFGLAASALMREAHVRPEEVAVIGSHGQSVAHHPRGTALAGRYGFTVQIGDPARIAARAGVAVVSDFRARDVALGGEGAPLVPYFDAVVFGDPTETRVLLNIGGIANLTLLPRGQDLRGIRAFDTGPGNMVLDAAIQTLTGGSRAFDDEGRMARKGTVSATLLHRWRQHPYFTAPPPKSTGREDFGKAYTEARIHEAQALGLGPEDVLATLVELVAQTIIDAVRTVTTEPVALIAAGGGVHHRVLMDRIRQGLSLRRPWETADAYGIPADAKEAIAFAYLAWQFLKGRATNVPSVTGAREPAMLGNWSPPPLPNRETDADSVAGQPAQDRPQLSRTLAMPAPRGEEPGPQNLRFRWASERDAPAVSTLLRSQPLFSGASQVVWEERVREQLTSGHLGFLALRTPTQPGDRGDPDPAHPSAGIEGVLLATDRTFGNCGYVRILAVRDGQTSQGVGTALMDLAERHFAALGRKAVFLMCTDVNVRAQRFYERRGYQRTGSLPDWLRTGTEEWLYVRRLDG